MDSVALGPFRLFSANYFHFYDESVKTSKKKKFSKIVKNTFARIQELPECFNSGKEQLFNKFRGQFAQFRLELEFGFSLLFYGFGSKLEIIEEFCIQKLTEFPIVIVDAFTEKFSPLEFGSQLLAHLKNESFDCSTSLEHLYSHISNNLSQKIALLFCGIENISIANLKLISILAENPNVIFITMIENPDFISFLDPFLLKRFKFIFHDLTTFSPYRFEFGPQQIQTEDTVSENEQQLKVNQLEWAKFVWASLPAKSQKIYKLIASNLQTKQCLLKSELAKQAIDQFLITNEKSLLPLLQEFFDHKLLSYDEEEGFSLPFAFDEINYFAV